jgi:predicted O-methyltransferase YrrM
MAKTLKCVQIDDMMHAKLPPALFHAVQQSRRMSTATYKGLDPFMQQNDFKLGLEIGRNLGWSAVMFALFNPEARLISIDIEHDPRCEEVFKHMGVADRIDVITGDSHKHETYPRGWSGYGYFLIDGDHTAAGAAKDWEMAQWLTSKGSFVLFDNLQHSDGCGKAFDQIVKSGQYVTQRPQAGLGIVQM